jgi:hypothetical protein
VARALQETRRQLNIIAIRLRWGDKPPARRIAARRYIEAILLLYVASPNGGGLFGAGRGIAWRVFEDTDRVHWGEGACVTGEIERGAKLRARDPLRRIASQ